MDAVTFFMIAFVFVWLGLESIGFSKRKQKQVYLYAKRGILSFHDAMSYGKRMVMLKIAGYAFCSAPVLLLCLLYAAGKIYL